MGYLFEENFDLIVIFQPFAHPENLGGFRRAHGVPLTEAEVRDHAYRHGDYLRRR
jgi:hypothetical protein